MDPIFLFSKHQVKQFFISKYGETTIISTIFLKVLLNKLFPFLSILFYLSGSCFSIQELHWNFFYVRMRSSLSDHAMCSRSSSTRQWISGATMLVLTLPALATMLSLTDCVQRQVTPFPHNHPLYPSLSTPHLLHLYGFSFLRPYGANNSVPSSVPEVSQLLCRVYQQ